MLAVFAGYLLGVITGFCFGATRRVPMPEPNPSLPEEKEEDELMQQYEQFCAAKEALMAISINDLHSC